jgi:hypothetical protein
MRSLYSALLSDSRHRLGRSNRWSRPSAGRRRDADVGYLGVWLGRLSVVGHGLDASALTTLRAGAIGSRRVGAARVLMLLAMVGAVLWLVLAAERPVAKRAVATGVSHTGTAMHHGLSSLPLAAQGVVSAALGNANEAYRVKWSGDGYRAVNPAQHLHARFGRGDVHVLSGGVRLGLRLSAIGYGGWLAAMAPVAPRAKGDRVVYTRPGLSEWYTNGPLGLEQGFTLTRAPAGERSRPLTLSLTLSGDTHATVDADGHGLTLTASAGSSLAYNDLLATDARGRALHAWITSQAGRVLLHVDTHGARYPLRIDPVIQLGDMLVQQGSKLTGKEETGEGQFGYSVALSPNGNIALIGAPADNKKVGAAWAFERSGGKWGPGVKLTGKEETGEGEFGYSVALSPYGNTGPTTALIGGPGDNKKAGAAWVFNGAGESWTQQGAKLTGKEETGEGQFGYSVALSSSGSTGLIGGPADNKKVGAAWAFVLSESKWAQQGSKLTGKEETGEGQFGYSVALSYNEYTALIGGPGDNKKAGAAWEFGYTEGKWTQDAKLTGKEEIGEGQFGYSVASAVSLEGLGPTALLIGGPGDNKKHGAAWMFTESKGVLQSTKLTAEEETGEGEFGYSVALSSNWNTALIGGPADNKKAGAAWVFTCFEGTCTKQGEKLVGSGETGEGELGGAVTLSANGNTALMGGFLDNKGTGGAWVYVTSSKLVPTFGGSSRFGYSVALSGEGNTALVGAFFYGEAKGAAWVFTRSGGNWTEQGLLTGKEEIGAAEFGKSVALSSEGNTALIGGQADNKKDGAAWVFTRSAGKWAQQGAKLTGKEEIGAAEFGFSVAISGEGGFLLIGGPSDHNTVGAAWAYFISAGKWLPLGPKLTAEGEIGEGYFGSSVALSREGTTALIGAAFESTVGSAWVFTYSISDGWKQQGAALTVSESGLAVEFGHSVALSADGNTALIGAPGANHYDGAAWVFTRSGGEWTQQGERLTGKEEGGEAAFGWSVALSSGGNTALIGAPFEERFDGAAWVFTHSGAEWRQLGPKLTGNEEILTTPVGYPSQGSAFGSSVALSSEANIALIGGPDDNPHGAVWTFAT